MKNLENLAKRIIPRIFFPYLFWFLKLYTEKKYQVKLGRGVRVSFETKFEGKNKVNDNVNLIKSEIGLGTYIASNSDLSHVIIGRFCSIGQNVKACIGMHPSRKFVSTHPAFFSLAKQAGFTFVSNQIFKEHKFVERDKVVKIGNDVLVGNDVIIFDGVMVGDGAIIGAGAIVTKDIEPYSVNVGIPARKIGYRFEEKYIKFLLRFKWWEKDFDWIKKNADLFSNIEKFYQRYKDVLC